MTPMTPSIVWWHGLAPVETGGPPGAEDHPVAWRDGELRLDAHPDPDADAALAALGGERCPCLDLFDAWTADHRHGSILVTGARTGDEVLATPAAAVDAIAADLSRWRGAMVALRADARAEGDGDVLDRLSALRSPEEAAARRRLGGLLLLTLDGRLQLRLQASVAAAFAADGQRAAALAAATASRAIGPLRRLGWAGGLSAIHVGDAGDELPITADRAILPPTWVAAVWGRGLTTTLDREHLVLDVTSVTPDGVATVRAAAPGKAQVEFRVDEWENA